MSTKRSTNPCRQRAGKIPVSSNIPHIFEVTSLTIFFHRSEHGVSSPYSIISASVGLQVLEKTYWNFVGGKKVGYLLLGPLVYLLSINEIPFARISLIFPLL
jgi:hypothetical protein